MLLIISLAAGSFTFAGQRGLTHAPAAVKMMSSSDRHTFDDPRQILNNFFHPGSNSKSAHVYSGLKDGSTGIDTRLAAPQADDAKDLVQDSCIDWGRASKGGGSSLHHAEGRPSCRRQRCCCLCLRRWRT